MGTRRKTAAAVAREKERKDLMNKFQKASPYTYIQADEMDKSWYCKYVEEGNWHGLFGKQSNFCYVLRETSEEIRQAIYMYRELHKNAIKIQRRKKTLEAHRKSGKRPTEEDFQEYGFEEEDMWTGSWRGEKTCHYCGTHIAEGSFVRYRDGSCYERGLRHANCARKEVMEEIREDEE